MFGHERARTIEVCFRNGDSLVIVGIYIHEKRRRKRQIFGSEFGPHDIGETEYRRFRVGPRTLHFDVRPARLGSKHGCKVCFAFIRVGRRRWCQDMDKVGLRRIDVISRSSLRRMGEHCEQHQDVERFEHRWVFHKVTPARSKISDACPRFERLVKLERPTIAITNFTVGACYPQTGKYPSSSD